MHHGRCNRAGFQDVKPADGTFVISGCHDSLRVRLIRQNGGRIPEQRGLTGLHLRDELGWEGLESISVDAFSRCVKGRDERGPFGTPAILRSHVSKSRHGPPASEPTRTTTPRPLLKKTTIKDDFTEPPPSKHCDSFLLGICRRLPRCVGFCSRRFVPAEVVCPP